MTDSDYAPCDNDYEPEAEHHNPYEENHAREANLATVHFHAESSSRDCDGPLDRSWTSTPNDDETVAEFFCRTVLFEAANNTVELTVEADGEWVIRYGHPTEEGYHGEEHRSCIYAACRSQKSSQRDHYARAMGY